LALFGQILLSLVGLLLCVQLVDTGLIGKEHGKSGYHHRSQWRKRRNATAARVSRADAGLLAAIASVTPACRRRRTSVKVKMQIPTKINRLGNCHVARTECRQAADSCDHQMPTKRTSPASTKMAPAQVTQSSRVTRDVEVRLPGGLSIGFMDRIMVASP